MNRIRIRYFPAGYDSIPPLLKPNTIYGVKHWGIEITISDKILATLLMTGEIQKDSSGELYLDKIDSVFIKYIAEQMANE